MSAAIEVNSLTKNFGPLTALDDVTFKIEEGTVCGFLGPNGAGKTTTIRSLLGLVRPTAGTATILGREYRELDEPIRAVGALLETAGYHPGRTALNHLRYVTKAAGLPSSRANEVLDQVGLWSRKGTRVGRFSMGMKQRLALAGALLGDPQVLLLDEPQNGLDPQGMRWLRGFLREQADSGKTVMVSSHALAEVAQTVDEVVIIARGRIVAQLSMDDLQATAGQGVRVRTRQTAKLRQLLEAEGFDYESPSRGTFVVTGVTSDQLGTLAADKGIPLLELSEQGQTLEELFFEMVGTEAAL